MVCIEPDNPGLSLTAGRDPGGIKEILPVAGIIRQLSCREGKVGLALIVPIARHLVCHHILPIFQAGR
jgi:hypothetical protein